MKQQETLDTMPNRSDRKLRIGVLLGVLLATLITLSCNPFAPSYDEDGLSGQNILGDRTNLDGFFTFFKNAYELRDTSLYGQLFTSDFTFVYPDFETSSEISWDRGQEMDISYNLFRGVKQINLDWNFYISRDSTELEAEITRNFNLNIVQNESAIWSGAGRARLRLRRDAPTDPWKIYYWFDDSDF